MERDDFGRPVYKCSVTYPQASKNLLSNLFNDETCRLCDMIDELRKLGNHTRANELQDDVDALDEIARQLGLISKEDEQ